MAYHVYQTNALILRSIDINDANLFVHAFTRELGLIRAVAKSARRERSKLRYSLQNYTRGNVALVRGKEVWRVTGAKEDKNIYHELKHDKKKILLFAHVTNLLDRLIQGEEKNAYLFDVIEGLITFLLENEIAENEYKALECLVVMHVLYSLGYIPEQVALFDTTTIDIKQVQKLIGSEKDYVRLINESLRESHL